MKKISERILILEGSNAELIERVKELEKNHKPIQAQLNEHKRRHVEAVHRERELQQELDEAKAQLLALTGAA